MEDDLVSAVIMDIGSSSCKIGTTGEEKPTCVFPNFVGMTKTRDK